MIKTIEYLIDGVVLTLTGVITSQEIYEANTKILERLNSSPYKYQLWLFQQVDDFMISTRELREAAMGDIEASKIHPGIKVAIATDSSLAFGISRMYEVFAEDSQWETMVFHTIEEAQKWINS
jgi:hypothetical protein